MALTDKLTNIADAIREKTGSTRTMNLEEMAAAVTNIKIPTALSDLNEDETHRTVTDAEKKTWNNKSNFSGNYDDLKNKQLAGTTDKLTPTQVYAAVSTGKPVKVQYTDRTYGVLSFTAFNVAESLNVIIVSQTIAYVNGVYILAELFGDTSNNVWGFMATTLAQKTDIPSVLPNPNALTFTGAVTGSYDGSEAMTVEIPAGGGGSGAVENLKLELIASGTMDADARGITVNLDNDGNPFELSIAALRVTNILRGADMTGNVISDIYFGNNWMPACITATTTSLNRDAVAVCTSFGIAYVAQGSGGNQSAASPKCYGAFLPAETIKTVSLNAAGAAETLGAGLTYYLYGVRV